MRSIVIILVLLAFLSGLYVYTKKGMDYESLIFEGMKTREGMKMREGLQSSQEKSAKCPNVLVKNGNILLLYNSMDNHDEIPVMFNNLDEYIEHIKLQRAKGIRCPVLYLQKENDAQGRDIYRIQSSPFEPDAGMRSMDADGSKAGGQKPNTFNDLYNEPFSDYVGTTISTNSNGGLSFPPSLIGVRSSSSLLCTDCVQTSSSRIPSTATFPKNTFTYPFFNIQNTVTEGFGSPSPSFSSPSPSPSTAVSSPSPSISTTTSQSSPSPSTYGTSNQSGRDVVGTSPPTLNASNVEVPRTNTFGQQQQPQQQQESQTGPNSYAGFDPYGLKQGKFTDLDKIHLSTANTQVSDNPMDPNWGGIEFTKSAVDSGKYIENNVYPANYSMPGMTHFYPGLYDTYPDPTNYTIKKDPIVVPSS